MTRFPRGQFDEHSILWSDETSPEWSEAAATSYASAQAATAFFPNGVSSGDVTQTSVVLWTRAVQTGQLIFQIATDASFNDLVRVKHVAVTDPLVPVKLEFDHLKPGQDYFYRVIDADGHVLEGSFETAAALGTHAGFNF